MMALDVEIDELLEIHQKLKKTKEDKYTIVLSGALPFRAEPDDLAPITESFDVEMLIPDTYPDVLPRVKETGGKIGSDYEHVFLGGTLCLGVPVEMRRIFFEQPSLLGFVNRLVIPYLYGYCHWKEYGEHPFGEQKHNGAGILQYYIDKLNLEDEVTALAFLCSLYEHGYRGHHHCPCGSGRIIRKCHGPMLLDLNQHHTPLTLHYELNLALSHCARRFEERKFVFPDALARQFHRIIDGSRRKRSKPRHSR